MKNRKKIQVKSVESRRPFYWITLKGIDHTHLLTYTLLEYLVVWNSLQNACIPIYRYQPYEFESI